MSVFWKTIVMLVAVTLLFAVQPACVYACSCVVPGPPEQAFADATAVFSGRVMHIDAPPAVNETIRGSVTFAVTRSWKGVDQATVVLRTEPASTCEFPFVEGQEYLVYASAWEGRLATSHCSRTALLADAAEDLAELGKVVPIEVAAPVSPPAAPVAPPAAPADYARWLYAAFVGVVLIVVAVGVLLTVRHRRASTHGRS